MKTCILIIAMLGLVSADPAGQGKVPVADTAASALNPFAAYFAGVELITSDKNLDPAQRARRYRRLCEITGVTGEKAKIFMQRFKSDPAGWQKFETTVMELLRKKE
jgi:hypothetical protein